jgi:protein involved in polysaccharide export with SLBB domain
MTPHTLPSETNLAASTAKVERRACREYLWLTLFLLGSLLASGCASWSNPLDLGIPVNRVPQEYLAIPKISYRNIPFTYLGQKDQKIHIVDVEDILGIFIEGILSEKGGVPPVRLPDKDSKTPSVGYPFLVNDKGEITLPQIPPLNVKGKTIPEVRDIIIKTYVDRGILKQGAEPGTCAAQVLVTLMRPRQIRVQVIRQEPPVSGGFNSRRGTAAVVDLPIYENDVLNAMTLTGGTPGLDAINEIIVQRRNDDGDNNPPKIFRIPLKLRDTDTIPFKPEDVKLQKNDIIFIMSRDTEVYYTAGLIGQRQYALPRDLDLRVTDAIANAGGPMLNGLQNTSNLTGQIVSSGMGSPSPSRVTVLRKVQGGGQLPIIVNLNLALADRTGRENIIIMPGDTIVLQESLDESFMRYYFTNYQFHLLDTFLSSTRWLGTQNLSLP